MSDELDEIRKKRMQELQNKNDAGQVDPEALREQEEAQRRLEERKQAILRSMEAAIGQYQACKA